MLFGVFVDGIRGTPYIYIAYMDSMGNNNNSHDNNNDIYIYIYLGKL